MMYKIPDKYYFRLHHIRPRFKNNIEAVLIYMATEISKISKKEKKEFSNEVNKSIYCFPGNINKKLKTINNWRTEIAALFGFIQSEEDYYKPGLRAKELANGQDLVYAFKMFLYFFQYPGGHLKPNETVKMINNSIRFKSAKFILELLSSAEEEEGKRAGITKSELTHCAFNDLRVTRDQEPALSVWKRIKQNRKKNLKYDERGDITRYAGDILDYMEIANLLVSHGKEFFINNTQKRSVLTFINSNEWFDQYDKMISSENASFEKVKTLQESWFNYVNQKKAEDFFETDILALIAKDKEEYSALQEGILSKFRGRLGEEFEVKTKEIGNMGENLVYGHECMRVKLGGRKDLIRLIQCIPNHFAIGYDIKSVELDETHRYIEVKTTVSNRQIEFDKFHLTTSEWKAAESNGERYFVYRLLLSKRSYKLFILQDPVGQYKKNRLNMIPRDGADIIFHPGKCGEYMELLIWKD